MLLNESLQMKTLLEVTDYLESIQGEASTVQVVQAATLNTKSAVDRMTRVDQSRKRKESNNVIDGNTQARVSAYKLCKQQPRTRSRQ